ncbi:MAG: hypothetical protein AVDCRST_MAG67-1857 [uncultured Solirubrobacteraceae bacterium]|uniref:Uncharacterized protein n=1 Tax=uncultured Solirubrobacteraceae bacterium TaxID=1162706 RepID=A0A6J4SPR6_9ACTN|nr:MAG: hypothetical protein AVDCRST_MAG67-1857 [uncultured Solirubrobacteraceae bacterium]
MPVRERAASRPTAATFAFVNAAFRTRPDVSRVGPSGQRQRPSAAIPSRS